MVKSGSSRPRSSVDRVSASGAEERSSSLRGGATRRRSPRTISRVSFFWIQFQFDEEHGSDLDSPDSFTFRLRRKPFHAGCCVAAFRHRHLAAERRSPIHAHGIAADRRADD